ncbi:MAG: FAD:protein FMN transferase, partial [Verrucomicrobiota bacterium]
GDDPVALRAAGEEALREIEHLNARLSLYRPDSDISRINARAAKEPVRVEPQLFRLLQQAQQLHRETGGVFDITIAPLMRVWGFMGGTGRLPDAPDLAEARARVGMQHVELDERGFTIRFTRAGVMLDLGSIGKGYALDRAAELLREAGVTSALLHGGTSTVYALGGPPGEDQWKIAVPHPAAGQQQKLAHTGLAATDIVATVPLRDESLSVSAVWGKSFEAGGRVYGHIIDPRTGEPTHGAVLAAVCLPSGTETDAFSTALLTLGAAGQPRLAQLRPGLRSLVLETDPSGAIHVARAGI